VEIVKLERENNDVRTRLDREKKILNDELKKYDDERKIFEGKRNEYEKEQARLNEIISNNPKEGMSIIKEKMVSTLDTFLEGYEPALVDTIAHNEQCKIQEIANQNNELKKEKEELAEKLSKLTNDLHSSNKDCLMYKSRFDLTENKKQVVEKKNQLLMSENNELSKLCEELLSRLEKI